VHERSTDPDVVKRLQAETEWAVKARRRYVELTPDDAVALKARITELSTMLRKNEEITRLRAVEKAAAALVEIRSGGARTGAGTPQEQAAWNQLGDALNGEPT
jgi:D-serine deaminase-like pyridoxal phosphate-dependent protein